MVHVRPAELATGMCMPIVYCARADVKPKIGGFWWDLKQFGLVIAKRWTGANFTGLAQFADLFLSTQHSQVAHRWKGPTFQDPSILYDVLLKRKAPLSDVKTCIHLEEDSTRDKGKVPRLYWYAIPISKLYNIRDLEYSI